MGHTTYRHCFSRRYHLRIHPTSTVFCLIVVCYPPSLLFVVVLSPFSSSRSSPVPEPHSSAPATIVLPSLLSLSCLFDCCGHPRQIQRMLFLICQRITNVQLGHLRRGRRGSGVHSAGDCRLGWRTQSGNISPMRPDVRVGVSFKLTLRIHDTWDWEVILKLNNNFQTTTFLGIIFIYPPLQTDISCFCEMNISPKKKPITKMKKTLWKSKMRSF